MSTEGRDSLDRRKRLTPTSTGKRVTPQDRDLLWFQKLREHGPLPTSFLLAFARDLRRSEKRARERLTDLFNESNTPDGRPYLLRPPQQFRTLDSRYNQLVYELAPAGARALGRHGLDLAGSAPPTGPWLHRFMTSCITASIELATLERPNVAFIPQSAILARAKATLRFPVSMVDPRTHDKIRKDLTPDAIFGLEYATPLGSRFRFFAVEADRATEPTTASNWNRKSFERNLRQYEDYVSGGVYRDHLQLTAPLMVLTISSEPAQTARALDFVTRQHPEGNSYMLFQTWEDFGPVFRPPQPRVQLLNALWLRAGLPGFVISQP